MKQAEIDFHVQTIGLNVHAIGAGLSLPNLALHRTAVVPMIYETLFTAMSLGMRLKQPPADVVGAIHGLSLRLTQLAAAIEDANPTSEVLIAGPWSAVCAAHNQFLREVGVVASPEAIGELWSALAEARAKVAAAAEEN